jgi:heat shock protein HtpX
MNNRVKLLLLWMLSALPIVIAGGVIGRMLALRIHWLIIIIMFVFAVVLVLALYFYFFSDKILLRWYHAKEVRDENSPLYEIVHRLATKADIPAPRIFIADSTMPNAFAVGRNAKHASIVVTNALVELLDKEEIEAVLAHELAHAKSGDTLIGTEVAVLSGILTALATFALWGSIFTGFGQEDDPAPNIIKFFVTSLVAPIAAVIIQLALSRSREYVADEQSVSMHGNPPKLVSALEKLEKKLKSDTFKVNPSHVHMFIMSPLHVHEDVFTLLDIHLPTYNSLFNTHPATHERVERLKKINIIDRGGS